jgi:FixJ family two-component response regulator
VRQANVILVDDDALVRTALERLLRSAGYKVAAFGRPQDFLLSLLPRKNACLLLDIYLSEMTGIQLWQELRASGFDIPTILITGQRDAQTEQYGQQVNAVAILYKPVEEKELFEAIDRALAQSAH